MTTNLCTTHTLKLPPTPADSGNPAQLLAVEGRRLTPDRWGLELTVDDEGERKAFTLPLNRDTGPPCKDCSGRIVSVEGVNIAPTFWVLDVRVEHEASCVILRAFNLPSGWVDA